MLPLLLIAAFAEDPATHFETKVRPMLVKNCYACHTKTEMGGLRVDSRERLLKGGKSGAAIVPGAPAESLLMQVVEYKHARLKMPPAGKIQAQEIEDLRQWIASGAVFPAAVHAAKLDPRSFWSLQPVKLPVVPANAAHSNIDRFVLARLEAAGLSPAPKADRRTLLRRVTFDLIGLPPTPAEMTAFLADQSPDAFAKVVDRLLASPQYGERWARHWLDLARYSDGQQGARDDDPYPNAFRYRDWVVDAFNRDLPYDVFLKAQIAADQLPGKEHLPALGFETLGETENDRLDVTTRAMLGFTVGCAQCHDHKFDPIPTRDYYSLLGVFKNSVVSEHPLVADDVVKAYKSAKTASEEKQAELKRFTERQTAQLIDMLASRTADYLVAVWKKQRPADLDEETHKRFVEYVKDAKKEHGYFAPWFALKTEATEAEVRKAAETVQRSFEEVVAEKRTIDDRNYVKLGGLEGMKDVNKLVNTLVEALPIDKFYFWRDLASPPMKVEDIRFAGGVYHYTGKDLDRWLEPRVVTYVQKLRADAETLKKAVPPLYPFWHVLKDVEQPKDIKVAIRGDANNPGEDAPRRFLSALHDGPSPAFVQGSGRLELANSIADPENPLTARVMVNRVWQWHFGQGIVRSTGNFGQLGDRPTHPELLDYLASRFMSQGWSLKALHREMLLSATYQTVSAEPAAAREKDPDNLLLSHANVQERLDVEALRDAVLAVAGTLDPTRGGASAPLTPEYKRRTLYVTISRSKPDRTLATFDFPDPNALSDARLTTVGPMQRLFFMNSPFVAQQSKALAERLSAMAKDDAGRIAQAYELLYGRPASKDEVRLGKEFLGDKAERWPQYAQVLLSASEFSAVQ